MQLPTRLHNGVLHSKPLSAPLGTQHPAERAALRRVHHSPCNQKVSEQEMKGPCSYQTVALHQPDEHRPSLSARVSRCIRAGCTLRAPSALRRPLHCLHGQILWVSGGHPTSVPRAVSPGAWASAEGGSLSLIQWAATPEGPGGAGAGACPGEVPISRLWELPGPAVLFRH